MNPIKLIASIGSALTLPMAILLVALFFLPWVSVNCQGFRGPQRVATASGLDLARGTVQLTDQAEAHSDEYEDIESRQPDPRPLYWAGLAIPVALAIVAAFGLAKRSAAAAGVLIMLLGVGGAVVTFMAAEVDYGLMPRQIDRSEPELQDPVKETRAWALAVAAEAMQSASRRAGFQTRAMPALTVSIVLYIVAAAVGLLMLVAAAAIGAAGASSAPPGSPPEEPTAEEDNRGA